MSGRIALATGLFWGVLVGCGGGRSLPADGGGGQSGNALDQQLIADVDVLFVIKDSASQAEVQADLVANFPVFLDGLGANDNGLPNLHLGVITTSMGAGAFTASIRGCQYPDFGNLVHDVRAAIDPVCSTVRITGSEHYIVALANESQTNYSGNLSDVFGCIAQVGSSGCGFEQPFAAARAALGDPQMGLTPPAGNQGFLRDRALLAVLMFMDEDDCSVPSDSMLFDPSQNMLSDPLGPLASFRCTEFGITCDGLTANNGRIPRTAGGPYSNCHSNDALAQIDPLHALTPLQFFVDYFQRVKALPGHEVLAAFAAHPQPFSVAVDPVTQFPSLLHSCSSSNGPIGDPAVRIKQLIDSLGDRGFFTSVCQNSYHNSMAGLARLVGAPLRNCLQAVPADVANPGQPVPLPDGAVDPNRVSCTAADGAGAIAPCNLAGQPSGTCWALLSAPDCATGIRAAVCRNGFAAISSGQPCPPGPNPAPEGDRVVLHCATP
ncbi:MAG TPA: hypothetical protein VKN99_02035 [Polyangia bacterium]|nr:hypothetical protein [Polyangia bacterium]